MKRQITFAGACYDRTQALIDGTVKPEGLNSTGSFFTIQRYGDGC